MDTVRFVVGVIFPYVAIAIFVVGMVQRLAGWKKLPSPPMTLYPAGSERGSKTVNVLKEAFLFRSLFKADRFLWFVAWGFHIVLAVIVLGHLRVVLDVDGLLKGLGMSESFISAMSSWVGGAAGILILLTAVILLLRRFTIPRVREITAFNDLSILVLIAAVVLTGNSLRFGAEHFDLGQTHSYFAGLATFSASSSTAVLQNGVFLLHLALALTMIMLIPYSKILHLGGTFFTQHLIRKH